MSLTAIGFGKKYLDKDLPVRKLLNEAIYPFYILHQTIIIILGNTIRNMPGTIISKSVILTLTSLIIITIIYWLIVRPWKITRLVFGMRWIRSENRQE